MNKVYKTVWNASLVSWVATSELTRSKSKSGRVKPLLKKISVATIMCFGFTSLAYADECRISKKGFWAVSGAAASCTINGTTTDELVIGSTDKILSISNNASVTITGDDSLNINASTHSVNDYARYQSRGIDLNNHGQLTTTGDINVTIKGNDPGKDATVMGIRVADGSELSARNITSSVVHTNENSQENNYNNGIYSKNPSGLSYALGVVSSGATAKDKVSSVTVHDADFNITNTRDTTNGFDGSIPDQMVGLFVEGDATNANARALFNSDGKVTIHAYDSSSSSVSDNIIGMAVSGNGSKISLHDSEVTLGKSGQYSSALKIGKLDTDVNTGGEIESTGHMILDSTAEDKASTIRLVGNNAQLVANFDTSSSDIRSGGTAILFGNEDTRAVEVIDDNNQKGNGKLVATTSKQETTGQKVLLNNTKISTTSKDASLFVTKAGVSDAVLTITGNNSDVTAADNGWLMEVEDPSRWEGKDTSITFNLDNGAVAKGQMTTAGDGILDVNISNGAQWILKPKEGEDKQNSTLSSLNLTNGGVLDASNYETSPGNTDYTITVPVLNNDNGKIKLATGKTNNSLTIDGNYHGANGAAIEVNAFDADSDVTPAVFHITGDASGSTGIYAVDGRELNGSIDENKNKLHSAMNIVVDGDSGVNTFSGNMSSTGAGQAQLTYTEVDGKKVYQWSMTSSDDHNSTGSDTSTGTGNGNNINNNGNGKDIYATAVPGYVVMPRLNTEQGYLAISTLSQRRLNNSDDAAQSWARSYGLHLADNGKERLGMETDIYGLQIGHDFVTAKKDNGSRNLTGVYVTYNHADTDFSDEYRAVNGLVSADKYMGKGKSDMVGVGVTNTYYTANGTYFDVVGQLSYIHNKYESRERDHVNQNGWSAAVSAEAGHTFMLTQQTRGQWTVEPQAQLIYQYLNLDDFNDGLRYINQHNQSSVRGRVGMRVAFSPEHSNEQQSKSFYALTNIWHDFTDVKSVDIGRDRLKEKYGSSWGEVGLGAKWPVIKNGYTSFEGSYQHDLGSGQRHGWRGMVDFKYHW